VLLPLPSEDETLLGRVLAAPPEPGSALEDLARPNPCAEALEPRGETPLASVFEDASELSAGASVRAMLGAYGFGADADVATHFVYRLRVERKVQRADTTAYEECCRDQGCGYGFISALIYGRGLYATGEEVSASAEVDVAFASAQGTTRLKTLHRREVRGYLAAVIRVTDPARAGALTPFGLMRDLESSEESMPQLVRREYERNKLSIEERGGGYVIVDGAKQALTENEFVRRFAAVTGSDELDAVEQQRNIPEVLAWAAPGVVGAGLIVYGVASLPWLTPAEGAVCGEVACTLTFVGAVAIAGSLPLVVYSLVDGDGDEYDHSLTELDARLLVGRYNRALLRKTIRSVQRGQSQGAAPRLRFEVRGAGAALVGEF
jgi:hypothetical protein